MSSPVTQQVFGYRTDATAWSAFWAEAGRDGCTAFFPPAVRQSIERRWRALFAPLGSARHLLDIACGRGAVLALAAGSGLQARLTGVDKASVSSDSGAFDITGGIDAASLPFPDQAHDIVTSQFGVEYAGIDQAMAEAARVCAGTLLVLSHAAEGVVCRQMREQADQIDLLLDQESLRARMLAGDIESLCRAIDRRAACDENISLLHAIRENLVALGQERRAMPPAAFAREIDELVDGLVAHRDRMRMLIGAAPDRAAIDRVVAALDAAGFDAVMEDERSGDDVVGHWIMARRRTSANKSGG